MSSQAETKMENVGARHTVEVYLTSDETDLNVRVVARKKIPFNLPREVEPLALLKAIGAPGLPGDVPDWRLMNDEEIEAYLAADAA